MECEAEHIELVMQRLLSLHLEEQSDNALFRLMISQFHHIRKPVQDEVMKKILEWPDQLMYVSECLSEVFGRWLLSLRTMMGRHSHIAAQNVGFALKRLLFVELESDELKFEQNRQHMRQMFIDSYKDVHKSVQDGVVTRILSWPHQSMFASDCVKYVLKCWFKSFTNRRNSMPSYPPPSRSLTLRIDVKNVVSIMKRLFRDELGEQNVHAMHQLFTDHYKLIPKHVQNEVMDTIVKWTDVSVLSPHCIRTVLTCWFRSLRDGTKIESSDVKRMNE